MVYKDGYDCELGVGNTRANADLSVSITGETENK